MPWGHSRQVFTDAHGITECKDIIEKLEKALKSFATAATTP